MKNLIYILLLITVNSCAYLINGTSQNVSVSSNYQKTKVIVDGIDQGYVPMTVSLDRCYDHNMIFVRNDKEEKYFNFSRKQKFSTSFFSAFFLGPIGLSIDENLCSLNSFDNKKINIVFEN